MIHTIPDCHSAESATKKSERKEIPTVELPVTDDSSAEKGRKRARTREVCGQTCLGLYFFPLAGMFSDGKCPLDHIDIFLFHFLQECMLEAGCLPRSLLSFSGQNGHEVPRKLWRLSPASAPQDLAAVPGSPSHHTQHQRWGKGLGWATTSSWQRE